ncbi:hypothetical protein RHGRI_023738 [Rhododendron griersonianum]|uniref:Uncharacterized protein n=1 Tax=Rhododendron griersonianum TaxID=479676 RepID=A0AAV6J4X4_9ERIC|nr:hypothetical protein RHGRI_023738 [Rhododendron griersonianum]
MAGREVREYTNLTDPKDRKLGKGKDKIDEEDITFQRMVAKGWELLGWKLGQMFQWQKLAANSSASSKWSRPLLMNCLALWDIGSFWVVDLRRCKRLQENVEATFMDEAFEHAALDSDDLLYLKEQMEAEEDAERLLRRTEKRAFAAFKISFCLVWVHASSGSSAIWLSFSSLFLYKLIQSCKFSGFFTCISSLGSTCGVQAKEWNKYLHTFFLDQNGIQNHIPLFDFQRQQDLLKKVVEVKPKRHRVSSLSDSHQTAPNSTACILASQPELETNQDEKQACPPSPVEKNATQMENPVKSLLAAYESSEDEYN